MKFTMKAARFYSHGDIRIEDVPAPASPPRPDYVTIKIAYCGICGVRHHSSSLPNIILFPSINSTMIISSP